MAAHPLERELVLSPRSRYDAIDVASRIHAEHGNILSGYRHVLYCSLHTTAGYLEQSLSVRLDNRRERLDPFIRAFQELFPPGANYRHDRLDLRGELSEEERRHEPRNADAHLAFIGSGLRNCVTYTNRAGVPVYFMDLDGVHGERARTRRTRVVAYHNARFVERVRCDVPVSRHPIDSINLADPRVGVLARADELLARHGIGIGRVDVALAAGECDAGVTVNEYETLLMRHDLAEVLADPLRFAASTGRRMLADPRAIPAKSLGYAKYDIVHVLNELMDALRISESALERLLARVMAVPASRFLRMKRSVSLLVSDAYTSGRGAIVQGRYQNPILVQWAAAPRRSRTVELTLTEFV
jgi:thiamine phosphate synthase YjbQ (UPF0047 family)